MGKILKRCSICGNFHAAYRVEDARLGTLLLCYSCWMDKYAQTGKPKPEPARQPDSGDKPSGQTPA